MHTLGLRTYGLRTHTLGLRTNGLRTHSGYSHMAVHTSTWATQTLGLRTHGLHPFGLHSRGLVLYVRDPTIHPGSPPHGLRLGWRLRRYLVTSFPWFTLMLPSTSASMGFLDTFYLT